MAGYLGEVRPEATRRVVSLTPEVHLGELPKYGLCIQFQVHLNYSSRFLSEVCRRESRMNVKIPIAYYQSG